MLVFYFQPADQNPALIERILDICPYISNLDDLKFQHCHWLDDQRIMFPLFVLQAHIIISSLFIWNYGL